MDYARFVFGTKKEALAFKKMEEIKGFTKLAALVAVLHENGLNCTLEAEDGAEERWLVDIDKSKAGPIHKDGDFWYIDLVEYIAPEKKQLGLN